MRKVFPFYLIVISLTACLDEKRVEPAKPSTFVRYINGGYSDDPRALEKTPDGGYVILANTLDFPNYNIGESDPADSSAAFPMDRVKLVKVDQYGSVLWTRILPDKRGLGVVDFRANGIIVYDKGYIITGEVIKSNGKSDLLIIQTDADGLQKDTTGNAIPHYEISLDQASGASVAGMALARISASRLLVLGSVNGTSDNMILAEVNISTATPTVTWNKAYGSRRFNILNKLFLEKNEFVFGGSISEATDDQVSDLRFLRAQDVDGGVPGDYLLGQPGTDESANDMCKTLNGYAFVGSSKLSGKQDRDILFYRFSSAGAPSTLVDTTYAVVYPGTDSDPVDVGLDDEGNSIFETSDKGFIILGTIQSAQTAQGSIGRGDKDYYLLRIDGFGVKQWAKAFGSKREDIGVAVLQAEDGGYVVLGRTMLANVPTITLIKTDGEGGIE